MRSIRSALLAEQGYVCAYCGCTVKADGSDSHIEHFWPRSHYPTRDIDYENLFISCGPKGGRGAPRICGDAKADWHDPANTDVIPSHPDSERRFSYNGNGKVRPSRQGDALVKTLIEDVLNLNDPSLIEKRKRIIAGAERALAQDVAFLDDTIAGWRSVDAEGRVQDLGHVAALYLEQERKFL